MMRVTMILLLAAVASCGPISIVTDDEIQIPAGGTLIALDRHGQNITYNLNPMIWELSSPPMIPTQDFTGTVEELYAFVTATYPAYDWPLDNNNNNFSSTTNTSSPDDMYRGSATTKTTGSQLPTPASLFATEGTPPAVTAHVVCGQGWVDANQYEILVGVTYLRHVPGSPKAAPGPRVCERVSCSWDSGIWFCNDNPSPLQLGSFSAIADMAEQITAKRWMGGCTMESSGPKFCAGQNFNYDAGWNVIVAGVPDGEHC